MSDRLHRHRGSPEPHAVSFRHPDPAGYQGHTTEVARWQKRRGHRPKWERWRGAEAMRIAEGAPR